MHAPDRTRGMQPHRKQMGLTLVELMVAMIIGLFLIVGAFTVYLHTRSAFQLTQTMARLQENGRFALATLAPDIRMAHYWGLTSRTSRIEGQATPTETASTLAPASDCGTNWSVDLQEEVGGTNDTYSWSCGAYGDGAQADTDTLVIRRAAEPEPTALDDDTLYVESGRFTSGKLFLGSDPPTAFAGDSETHKLVVNGYYISQSSTLGDDIPSLRVKQLAPGPTIRDEEVMPGVEDMQVQFGIDDDPVGSAGRGSVDRYVNPGDALLSNSNVQILTVRVWLRIRALKPQTGFKDDRSYTYAGHTVSAPNDHYHRIVVSRTIYIRNARKAT